MVKHPAGKAYRAGGGGREHRMRLTASAMVALALALLGRAESALTPASTYGAHFADRERSDRSIVNSRIGIVNTEQRVRGRSGATPGHQASS